MLYYEDKIMMAAEDSLVTVCSFEAMYILVVGRSELVEVNTRELFYIATEPTLKGWDLTARLLVSCD